MYMYLFFFRFFPHINYYRTLSSSLCYTVGSCQFSVLCTVCVYVNPKPLIYPASPHLSLLVTISLVFCCCCFTFVHFKDAYWKVIRVQSLMGMMKGQCKSSLVWEALFTWFCCISHHRYAVIWAVLSRNGVLVGFERQKGEES